MESLIVCSQARTTTNPEELTKSEEEAKQQKWINTFHINENCCIGKEASDDFRIKLYNQSWKVDHQASLHNLSGYIGESTLLYVNKYCYYQTKHLLWKYVRIPVLFGDSVQATEHDREDLVDVLLNEAEDVLVVPEVQSSLCHLWGQTENSKNR